MASTADERRGYILDALERQPMVKVVDLSRRFGVSEVSIRRDLERLEQFGLLKRVHGGAVVNAKASRAQAQSARARQRNAEKEGIGCAAAGLIRAGERLIFDSGSTVLQVARSIPGDLLLTGNLTVITASLPIVRELGAWQSMHLIVLGGIYLPDYEMVAGPQTIDNLRGLHADRMFLGTDGLTFARGVTTANVLEAEVDRAMVEAAREVVVVADSSKIGVVGLTTILPLTKIDRLISDSQAPTDFVAALREQWVEVVIV